MLTSTWRSEPEWHPKAIKLAARMTDAMVAPDPMDAMKEGCGVVSNMPWVISLQTHRLLTLMSLLDSPAKLSSFVSQHRPEAFVLLLQGRTPHEAIDKDPRVKAWFELSSGKLKLQKRWLTSLELVDWRVFRNKVGVNLVVMVVPKNLSLKSKFH